MRSQRQYSQQLKLGSSGWSVGLQGDSFDRRDPVFTVGPWRVSIQVATLENSFGLDPARCRFETTDDGWRLTCDRLSWAGQQQRAPGLVELRAAARDRGMLAVSMRAEAPAKIRCLKLTLRDLPPLEVLDLDGEHRQVPAEGVVERYPNPLKLPLGLYRSAEGGATWGARCEDDRVREKRFASYRENYGALAGRWAVELIHEESATRFDTRIVAPPWILASDCEPESFRTDHLAFAERALGLRRWEERADVPPWLREVALCLTLNGMHWSGYVFNTYAEMAAILRFVAERIEGRRVLAYLPGWEGRYYWQYGDYRPEPGLGGEEGFEALCVEARRLGIHLMPMFGGNCVNAWLPSFASFGPGAYMHSATRHQYQGNKPDWDRARAYDTGWQTWLNPGHPSWQRELSRQILGLA